MTKKNTTPVKKSGNSASKTVAALIALAILTFAVSPLAAGQASVQAGRYYQSGIDAYVNGNLKDAVGYFQLCLSVEPENREARQAMELVLAEDMMLHKGVGQPLAVERVSKDKAGSVMGVVTFLALALVL